MREFHGTATGRVDATPEAVFDVITDVGRLPEWNDAIESVTERPPALTEGAEWVVVMHPARMPRWKSRSRVEEIDRHALRFAYRTRQRRRQSVVGGVALEHQAAGLRRAGDRRLGSTSRDPRPPLARGPDPQPAAPQGSRGIAPAHRTRRAHQLSAQVTSASQVGLCSTRNDAWSPGSSRSTISR